ncbi:signal peptidase I [Blastococcus sp. TBT05-19]|uniref:signal peptidase I n=1 Tax=Blastococcus sp. TBT05-19 TaxID=2250581 RepID=UPI001314EB6F|nr:signal peptidase I [Blastococcus sp. TBT05-19]
MTRVERGAASGTGRVRPVARAVVVLGLTVLTALVLAALVPLAAGYSAYVVTSGSMAPRVNPGDVVVTHPVTPAELRTGQVVLVEDVDVPGGLLLHRLVSFDEEGRLVTRGDANQSDDSVHPEPSQVRGVAALRVPWVGLPALWLEQGSYGAVAATVAVLAAGAVFAARPGRRRAADVPRDGATESPDVDPEAPTAWDLPPVGDAEPVREAPSLPPVPPARRAEPLREAPSAHPLPPVRHAAPVREAPSARPLPPVPPVRSMRHDRPVVVAALPIHLTSSSSGAARLSKTGTERRATVRSFARPAVSTTGGEGSSAPTTRQARPPVSFAVGDRRDDRGAAARAPGPRVAPAGERGNRTDGGNFGGQPRR